jgi:hypothetical protein
MDGAPRPELAGLRIADPLEHWRDLGFDVVDERIELGGISIQLVDPAGSGVGGITGWTLRHVDPGGDIDGLPTSVTTDGPAPVVTHPNGATALDHVVIVTPDFDRTAASLARASMPLRRVRDAGGFRQGFRRLGPAIMEIVETPGALGKPRFWGLVIVVSDLEALRERLQPHLGEVRGAVQPGRHIATLSDDAGVTPKVAFMDAD